MLRAEQLVPKGPFPAWTREREEERRRSERERRRGVAVGVRDGRKESMLSRASIQEVGES